MIKNSYNKKISEIIAIDSTDFGYGFERVIIKNREDLRKIIEEPCLPACLTLYDKNIRTVNSSANKSEIGGKAYIGINYDSLDENNKEILNSLIKTGIIEPLNLSNDPNQRGGRDFMIKVPVYENDTVGIVSDRFMQIISNFEQQDVLYGKYTKEEAKQYAKYSLALDPNTSDEELIRILEELGSSIEKFLSFENLVFDPEEQIYWYNEELYNKHKEYQRKQKGNKEQTIEKSNT